MTLKLDIEQLEPALATLSKITQAASNSPVYKCVMMVYKGGKLRLRGTDLITFYETVIDCEVVGTDVTEGSWLVVFEPLHHYVRTSKGTLELDFKDNVVEMRSGQDKATAKLRDTSDFTPWHNWKELTPLACDPIELADAIKQALPSVSTSLITPQLYNVSLLVGKTSIDVQASNSFKYQVQTLSKKGKDETHLLLPHNAAIRFADLSSDLKEVGYAPSLLGFRGAKSVYYFRLSTDAAKYPVFRDMPIAKATLTVELPKDELNAVLAKALGFTENDYKQINLSFDVKKKTVTLAATSMDFGSYVGSLKAKSITGDADLLITVDGNYLQSFVKGAQADTIKLDFTDHRGAIKIEDIKRPNLLYVMFPLLKA